MTSRTLRALAALIAATAVGFPAAAAAQDAPPRTGEERRVQWQKVDDIFNAMAVRPGAVVADLGAGDGFFTVRLSHAVGAGGRVHAVDVSADVLRRLRARVADEGLSNVVVTEGAAHDPRLPAGTVDAVLIVNAYHEMDQHQALLGGIRAALKPGGRLVIVEPIAPSRRKRPRDEQTRNHEIDIEYVREDTRDAGFTEVLVQDPFTARPQGNDEEWLLALTPATPQSQAAPVWSSKDEAWKSPALRVPVREFKRRIEGEGVLLLDVRDPDSYRAGHLPGAVLMTPEEISTPEGLAKLKGEKRLIVAYCS